MVACSPLSLTTTRPCFLLDTCIGENVNWKVSRHPLPPEGHVTDSFLSPSSSPSASMSIHLDPTLGVPTQKRSGQPALCRHLLSSEGRRRVLHSLGPLHCGRSLRRGRGVARRKAGDRLRRHRLQAVRGEEAEHAFDQAKEGRFVRPERLQEQGRVQVLSDGRGEGAH